MHHAFLGSVSAVTKRNIAPKYAFFQVLKEHSTKLLADVKKVAKPPSRFSEEARNTPTQGF
jgi:hypothetical protein